jgi:hypothetical protein
MKRKWRLAAAILILSISLSLLAWAYWPAERRIQVLPIEPSNLTLPTPVSFLPELPGDGVAEQ